ncbi:sigma-E processing peptidase SpoIIGA [Peribacillus sp. SCS-155]|uniref:sigma-E processing peptidase SpoIIGA n=1 Tax=Peribacillus sedimenti TaxID=3115297 RepID=UPI003905E1BF
MTLYLDVIWLLNWLFDCLLLYWTAILLKRRAIPWRIILGGLMGSLIVVFAFTPYSQLVDNLYVKLLFSIFMILIAFGYGRWKVFIKNTGALYFITFLSGGILLGMHFLFNYHIRSLHPGMAAGVNRFGDPVSWLYIMIGFPLAWHFSKRTLDDLEMAKVTFDQMVLVCINVDQYHYKLNGLVDSGNQLYDPLSKMPVMIVSIAGQEDNIPPDVLPLFKDPDLILAQNGQFDYSWADKMRIVPCKVVGNDHQLLTAIKPDSIIIYHESKMFEVERGLVSFTSQQLSPDNAYHCIVHPKMLTGIPVESAS